MLQFPLAEATVIAGVQLRRKADGPACGKQGVVNMEPFVGHDIPFGAAVLVQHGSPLSRSRSRAVLLC